MVPNGRSDSDFLTKIIADRRVLRQNHTDWLTWITAYLFTLILVPRAHTKVSSDNSSKTRYFLWACAGAGPVSGSRATLEQ